MLRGPRSNADISILITLGFELRRPLGQSDCAKIYSAIRGFVDFACGCQSVREIFIAVSLLLDLYSGLNCNILWLPKLRIRNLTYYACVKRFQLL